MNSFLAAEIGQIVRNSGRYPFNHAKRQEAVILIVYHSHGFITVSFIQLS